MKRIDKLQVFNPQTMHPSCNLLHDKAGLKILNINPHEWKINAKGNKICHANGIQQITITSLCNHLVGSLIKLTTDYLATIETIQLKRLADITEFEAMHSGVESKGENIYKHYCPDKFHAPDPYCTTALGSFHSLWMKKYGITEIATNPWIWQYTIKYDKERSLKK
jgi:hypothetical protein